MRNATHLYQKGKVYSVPSYEEKIEIEKLKDSIFFQIKRFQRDEATQQATFDSQSLTVEPSCTIGESSYDLMGFVVHLSATPKLALSNPGYGGIILLTLKRLTDGLSLTMLKNQRQFFPRLY